jgi:ABC-type transport system involved in cytochrome bd biosynthesis fused ATPase/permease subunit
VPTAQYVKRSEAAELRPVKALHSSVGNASDVAIDALAAPRVKDLTIDFRFEDLGLQLKGSGFSVLAGVTGEIKHGRVTAVMGPSGAGKSSFLTTLSGKATYGITTGKRMTLT